MPRALATAFFLLLAACSTGDQGAPPVLPPAPDLLAPRMGATIAQNDPTIGCPFSDTHGYGFAVDFHWSGVADATAYHLRMHHLGSVYAALDTVVSTTGFQYQGCNAYVIDTNLYDWQWTVAGVSDAGDDGPWAAEGTYEFAPMAFPPQP